MLPGTFIDSDQALCSGPQVPMGEAIPAAAMPAEKKSIASGLWPWSSKTNTPSPEFQPYKLPTMEGDSRSYQENLPPLVKAPAAMGWYPFFYDWAGLYEAGVIDGSEWKANRFRFL